MHRPLVSIMVPTLPDQRSVVRALASLRLQRYERWQAIVVVDGQEQPWLRDALERFADSRVERYVMGRHAGRGAVRARALQKARGEWLAFVDADDWWMPAKLHEQLRVVEERPSLALLTAGLAIVDESGTLRGERGWRGSGCGFERQRLPPLHFAPSLIRCEVAQRAGFSARFRAGEDRDFLMRVLRDAQWASLDEPLYVYDEYGQQSLQRALRSHWQRVQLHAREGQLSDVVRAGTRSALGVGLAAAAHLSGAQDLLVARRSSPPSQKLQSRFALAKRLLDDELLRLGLEEFGFR